MRKRAAVIGILITALTVSAAAQTNTFPASGNVGIGTTGPQAPLEIVADTGNATEGTVLRLDSVGCCGNSGSILFTDNGDVLQIAKITGNDAGNWGGNLLFMTSPGIGAYPGGTPTERMRITSAGNVGIGTTSPGSNNRLEVNGNIALTANSGASITFQDGTTQTTAWTGVLCGGDYAESVNIFGDRAHYEPGDVLVIDPDHPGQFLKSASQYSTSVTGVYSTKPGTVGRRQTGPNNPDEVPMAMIGIVPTKVSAENGPVHPGDLLVTSSTIGYAMKGTDRARMLGAVIGKALGSVESGKGEIEVVITLQ